MPELKIAARLSAFNLPLKKALHAAAQAGATGVEIDARNGVRPSELTDTACRQLRKMLDDLNLRVSSVRFQTRHGYGHQNRLDERVDATKQAMRMAYRLGCDVVSNQIGRIPADPESESYKQLATVLSDLGRFGTHIGAFLAAETGTESGEQMAALLTADPSALLGAAFNPGNLIINGFSVDESLVALRETVRLVIARDGVQDLAQGRGIAVPVGDGTADFPQILGRLEERQYRGWFVVGADGEGADQVTRNIQYLSSL
ncbi:Inosose dehydratase [Roseimaritima multifibrata]|uniref:Inosose dehydratase n=1 Tax=Roseimaritima multifibrata TaxID=1930274 RepID=A0A517MJG9_9BACT|nr:sugar phosphate isomerase/epimerase family protein [Roseimaritima multifibrata]QDS95045.1 Inosose dehydratase [Roseimaritima multifibrata]